MTKAKQDKQAVKHEEELNKLVDAFHKTYGKESIRKGIIAGQIEKWPVIETRSLSLDMALGIGGYPKGRITEIFGPESSGKTTLATIAVANAQAAGGVAAYIDAEHAIDPAYMAKLGVNLDDLLFSQPDYMEEALDITEKLVLSNKVDIVVVDSVAALVPKAELEGNMGDQFMGLHARLMGQAMRKLKGVISKSRTAVIFINQIREKMNTMPGASNEVTPGGRALKFYSSVRIDIRRIGAVKDKEEKIGNETKVKVIKNKLAPPFKEANFHIIFNKGIDRVGDILDNGVKCGVIEKGGAGLAFDGDKLGHRLAAISMLEDNKELFKKIEDRVRSKVLENMHPVIVQEEDDAENIEIDQQG